MNVIEQEKINNLANTIILAKYPIWKQLNLIDLKNDEYSKYIEFKNKVIEDSNSSKSYDDFFKLYYLNN